MTIYNLTLGGATKRSTLGQHTVEIDTDKLVDANASMEFATRYGLKQYLADAMAGAENEADAAAKIAARVAKFMAGDFARTKGEAKDAPDSIGARAIKLATATIRQALKAKNAKADKDVIKAAAVKLVADDPKWKADAEAQLAAEKAMGENIGEDLLKTLGL